MKATDIFCLARRVGRAIMVGFAHLMVVGFVALIVIALGLSLGGILGTASTIICRDWLTGGFILLVIASLGLVVLSIFLTEKAKNHDQSIVDEQPKCKDELI